MARTVTVTLGPHYEKFIQSNIAGGRYNNVSEVIRAGLRRLEEDEMRLAALRSAIDEGDASPDVVGFDRNAFLEELKEMTSGVVRDVKTNKAGMLCPVCRRGLIIRGNTRYGCSRWREGCTYAEPF